MSLFWIAWKSIRFRGFASLLTIISMTLGVMLVVCVLTIHGVVKRSFSNDGEVGYDIIIGAKGGNLQLALNSVYYLSQPVETIPYEFLMACEDQEFREKELRNSIHFKAHRTRLTAMESVNSHIELMGLGGPANLANELTWDAYDETTLESTGIFESGIFVQLGYVDFAIPILLGDYFDEFRVVATSSKFFEDRLLEFPATSGDPLDFLTPEDGGDLDDDDDEPEEAIQEEPKSYEELHKVRFEFAQGRAFEDFSEENAYFECVLGARVARETGKQIGDRIQITHGVPASKGGDKALHKQTFVIVGILKPTGRPDDRVVLVNMEGFFLMNDHANDLLTERQREEVYAEKAAKERADEKGGKGSGGQAEDSNGELESDELEYQRVRLPLEQRRISAILLASANSGGVNPYSGLIQRAVNKGRLERETLWTDYSPPRLQKAAAAIYPILEINNLFAFIVTPIQTVLLVLTLMICIVSGISILVSIYNSMSDRRHEIAVMRALGANQGNVFSIILVESTMLGIFGLVIGWLAGHGIIAIAAPFVDQYAGVSIGFFDFASPINEYLPWIPFSISAEFFLLPGILLLAVLVGVIPAISAYRTDVSQNLGK